MLFCLSWRNNRGKWKMEKRSRTLGPNHHHFPPLILPNCCNPTDLNPTCCRYFHYFLLVEISLPTSNPNLNDPGPLFLSFSSPRSALPRFLEFPPLSYIVTSPQAQALTCTVAAISSMNSWRITALARMFSVSPVLFSWPS